MATYSIYSGSPKKIVVPTLSSAVVGDIVNYNVVQGSTVLFKGYVTWNGAGNTYIISNSIFSSLVTVSGITDSLLRSSSWTAPSIDKGTFQIVYYKDVVASTDNITCIYGIGPEIPIDYSSTSLNAVPEVGGFILWRGTYLIVSNTSSSSVTVHPDTGSNWTVPAATSTNISRISILIPNNVNLITISGSSGVVRSWTCEKPSCTNLSFHWLNSLGGIESRAVYNYTREFTGNRSFRDIYTSDFRTANVAYKSEENYIYKLSLASKVDSDTVLQDLAQSLYAWFYDGSTFIPVSITSSTFSDESNEITVKREATYLNYR